MAIERELLDQLLAGRDPQDLFAKDGLVDELKKALSERLLNAELDEHLTSKRTMTPARKEKKLDYDPQLKGRLTPTPARSSTG